MLPSAAVNGLIVNAVRVEQFAGVVREHLELEEDAQLRAQNGATQNACREALRLVLRGLCAIH